MRSKRPPDVPGRFATLGARLEAAAKGLPQPKVSLPASLSWVGWTTCEELMCLERLAQAAADELELGEPGALLWTELEVLAKTRRSQGWLDEDRDPARYEAHQRAGDHRFLTLAERLRCHGTLAAPPRPLVDWRNNAGSPAETYSPRG
jgi:hypothetical protein